MKKILTPVFFVLSICFAFAQSSDATLTTQSDVIRNEATAAGNTKVRIANMYQAIIDSKASLLGSYANPTWITSIAWGKIAGTPTTLAGYGITDAVPSSRTINSQPLTTNLNLTASNIGLSNVDNTSDVNKPVSTAQQTALDLKANKGFTINTQTDNYTLVLSDANTVLLDMNKASAKSITFPPDASVAFPLGTVITYKRSGLGLLTTIAGAGVTLNPLSGALTDAGLNFYITAIKVGTNTWDLQNGGYGVWTAFTPTFTGYSVQPGSVDAAYTQLGPKLGIIQWDMASAGGTSNSTSFTMTIPWLARSQRRTTLMSMSGGTYGNCEGYTSAGSNVVSFSRGAAAFSATLGKGVWGTLIVEIQ